MAQPNQLPIPAKTSNVAMPRRKCMRTAAPTTRHFKSHSVTHHQFHAATGPADTVAPRRSRVEAVFDHARQVGEQLVALADVG
jgi:hypothetical protein